jgi:DnaJ-domain-containing protein 1
VSVTRKIIDGARSGLNSLLDKVSADDTPLSGIERDGLDAELERRVLARKEAAAGAGQKAAVDNPRARWAGAGDEAARRRREMADAREKRMRSGRAAKKESDDRAREAAWQKFQAEAKRQAPPPGSGSGSASGSGSGGGSGPASGARRPFAGKDDKIAKYYKTLDLPYGADFDQVKASYRKLMRKYHPDLHVQSPQKQKAATELTMQVTQAYNELEIHLNRK